MTQFGVISGHPNACREAVDREAVCSVCGVLRDGAQVCPSCGSRDKTVRLRAESRQVKVLGGRMGFVKDSPAAREKPHSIAVQTPLGSTSEAHLSLDGRVSLAASGRPDVGRCGEPQVTDILVQRLIADGCNVSLLAGAADGRGEDALLQMNGERVTVQATSVPSNSPYWRQAAHSSARTDVDIDGAVEWLREAIVSKSFVDDRSRTILAIDARHAGVLGDSAIRAAYLLRHPSPTSEYGFAQTWIVGPTASHCIRL